VADIPIRDHHFRPRQRPERIPLTGRIYRWEHGGSPFAICMVAEEDLDFVLAIKKGCCGHRGHFYKRATQEEYESWLRK
jgi:hypothetical protein